MNKNISYNFNQLPLSERCNLVNCYGKTVMWTDYNEYRITLYEIDCELIEVWFDIYNSCIYDVRIPSYNQLDIHLHGIKFII